VPLADFKPQIDLWLVHRPSLGRLQTPIDQFGAYVAQALRGSTHKVHAGATLRRA